jgi:hypothetical protein
LSEQEIKVLRSKKLVEGRKPNFHISSSLAKATGNKAEYIKQRGIDDGYCQKIILDYLEKFGIGKKVDFEAILLDKLPDVLSGKQKRNKIKNNLQKLKNKGLIHTEGRFWKKSKSK